MNPLTRLLDRPTLTPWLLVLHALALVGAVFLFRNEVSGDQATYLGLAEGLAHGTFSYWGGVFTLPPIDTYRTQGYPVFLLLVRMLSTDVIWVKLVQMVLQFGVLLLAVALLKRLYPGAAASNLFLLIALPQLQLLYYTQLIFPETLMVILVTASAVIGLGLMPRRRGWLLLGGVLAIGYWVRPALLFLPVLVVLMDLVLVTKAEKLRVFRRNVAMAMSFALLGPVPFACWNYSAHGHFTPVPITGSAVVSNLGIWQLKLPGYGSMHYFAYSYFGREAISWTSPDEAARNYAEFQSQWQRIDSVAGKAESAMDSARIPVMEREHPDLFVTRSAAYTIALDKAIADENFRMVRQHPGYYLASRIYTAARLWVTNINLPMERIIYTPHEGERPVVDRPKSMAGWAKAWYPFVLSFLTFGLGIPFLAWSVYRHWDRWYPRRWLLYPVLYLWLVHIPMCIQSRYTVPAQILVIACLALCLVEARGSKRQEVRIEE